MDEYTHIDLFSGIGGFSLAAESVGFKTILFCEIDEFCQKVLKKHWPKIPIIKDIRDLDGTKFRGSTLITGGFPCQPFSVAGQRRGKNDDRHLWPEMLRVIKEARPRWICGENVTGIVRMELDQVLVDLENTGYSTQAIVIPACSKNAPHRRGRVWIIANSIDNNNRRGPQSDRKENKAPEVYREEHIQSRMPSGANNNAPDSNSEGLQGDAQEQFIGLSSEARSSQGSESRGADAENKQWKKNWLEVAARFCRMDDGLPSWIHSDRAKRLKALGNAIVPQVAREIIGCIYKIEEKN